MSLPEVPLSLFGFCIADSCLPACLPTCRPRPPACAFCGGGRGLSPICFGRRNRRRHQPTDRRTNLGTFSRRRGVIGLVVLQVLGVVNPFKRGRERERERDKRRGVCVHLLYIQRQRQKGRRKNTAEWLKCLMHNTRSALLSSLFCLSVMSSSSVVATCSLRCRRYNIFERAGVDLLRLLRRPSIGVQPSIMQSLGHVTDWRATCLCPLPSIPSSHVAALSTDC